MISLINILHFLLFLPLHFVSSCSYDILETHQFEDNEECPIEIVSKMISTDSKAPKSRAVIFHLPFGLVQLHIYIYIYKLHSIMRQRRYDYGKAAVHNAIVFEQPLMKQRVRSRMAQDAAWGAGAFCTFTQDKNYSAHAPKVIFFNIG